MLTQLTKIKIVMLSIALAMLTACGFKFQTGELVPQSLRTLSFDSNDPYSDMSMIMRKQLQLNNINLVDTKADVASLRINKISQNDNVVSVFKQGREAEKVLVLKVDASVKLPNKPAYPIQAKVSRTFFDNSRAALAKSAEKETIWRSMREQAARELISKMVAVEHQTETLK